jgi:hypothetical protein
MSLYMLIHSIGKPVTLLCGGALILIIFLCDGLRQLLSRFVFFLQTVLLHLRITAWQMKIYGLIIRLTLRELWNLVSFRINRVGRFYLFCAHRGFLHGRPLEARNPGFTNQPDKLAAVLK